ncbi:MAG: alanine racemase [Bacteroidales bacterium]|nr:alanine racemase [Bacteroidales bacterium]
MNNTSYIEISKKAYLNNIKFLQKVVGKQTKICSVIKGNAYGHGYANIIPLAEDCGIRHFSVFSAFEAMQAYPFLSAKSQLIVLGYITNDQLEWVIENNIEFYVYNLQILQSAIGIAKKKKITAKIHIELETGLNRIGIDLEYFDELIHTIQENRKFVEVIALCTHFAGAESIANYHRVKNQLILFKKYHKYYLSKGIVPEMLHTASSSAALIYPETRFDMVRIGIAQYGYWPTQEVLISRYNKFGDQECSLKRVISWKTEIMEIKAVKRGVFIGYGNSFQASRDMLIAIIPVGYNNGYSRSLSNRGHVLIHGKRVDILGVVTMNTISVNITYLRDVRIGDEVVLIGNQLKNKISVASFGEMSNYLNYQVLARLPDNIPRYVVD